MNILKDYWDQYFLLNVVRNDCIKFQVVSLRLLISSQVIDLLVVLRPDANPNQHLKLVKAEDNPKHLWSITFGELNYEHEGVKNTANY